MKLIFKKLFTAPTLLTSLLLATLLCGCDNPQRSINYDVLVSVSTDQTIKARVFPPAPVKEIQIEDLGTQGTEQTTIWDASARNSQGAVAQGLDLTVGVLPADWTETTPLTGTIQVGHYYAITLVTADGQGRAIQFINDQRITPQLFLTASGGQIIAHIEPAVDVTAISLYDSDGAQVWQAIYSDLAGAMLPAGGMSLGEAPSNWLAALMPLNEALIDQAIYQVRVEIPGNGSTIEPTTLTSDIKFSRGSTSQWQQQNIYPVGIFAVNNQPPLVGRAFETQGHNVVAFVPALNGALFNKGYALSESGLAQSSSYYLSPIPGYGFNPYSSTTTTNPDVTLNSYKNSSNMAEFLDLGDNQIATSLVMGPSGTVSSGKLHVIESLTPTTPFSISSINNTSSAWNYLTGSAGIGITTSAHENTAASLIKQTIAGLTDQNALKPYVVSSTSSTVINQFQILYHTTGLTWAALPTTGIVPTPTSGWAIPHFKMAATQDGSLYGCAHLTHIATASASIKVFKFEPTTSQWAQLVEAPQGVTNWASFREMQSCFITTSQDKVYVTANTVNTGFTDLWTAEISTNGVVSEVTTSANSLMNINPLSKNLYMQLRDFKVGPDQNAYLAFEGNTGIDGNTPTLGGIQYLFVLSKNAQGQLVWNKVLEGRIPLFMQTTTDGNINQSLSALSIGRDFHSLLGATNARTSVTPFISYSSTYRLE